jgi:hypothetical protein
MVLHIAHNGPAIKLVGVAERMEVVTTSLSQGRVPVHNRNERSMARVFAVQVQSFLRFTSVAVQMLWRAGHKSRYTEF